MSLDYSFGNHKVSPEEREQKIRRVFKAVAPRYDLMNDLMSMGIHRLWKNKMARLAASKPGEQAVDLAGGTGDVAKLLAASGAQVLICDPSLEMMRNGKDLGNIGKIAAPGEFLPFGDNSFDLLTIAFGIRNVTSLNAALAEIFRVLKPGGRLVCLEFSRPLLLIRPFYDLFSFTVIPRLGSWVAKNPEAYEYLVESIRKFPNQQEFKDMIEGVGFEKVGFHNLSLGIAAIHIGFKP